MLLGVGFLACLDRMYALTFALFGPKYGGFAMRPL